VIAVFLAMIAPGPDMLFVLATGARGGPRAGLLATLGVASSEIVQITAVAAGLAAQFAILGAIFIAFEVLVDGAVGLTAGRLGRWLSRRRRARQALDVGSGTIMVALAGRLALER
jgi:threonine/homoserine/homoserine lactone efflux protein